jgi:PAS domain S-box-containing protein
LLEEKLKENEDYLKTILENTKDGIISSIPDKDFLITFWNKGAEEIYGYKSSEAVGQKADELLHTRFPIVTQEEAVKFLHDNNYWEGEILQKNKAGEDINILISIKLFKNTRYNSIEAVSILRDITEQKQSEKKLKEYTDKLKKSNRELESFAHRAAHDLKNPLNILMSGLKILKKNTDIDEEKRAYLIDTMIERSNQLISQINNILKYAQIAEDKNLIKVNVKNMINKAVSDLNKIIKEKDAEIITKDMDKEILADIGLFYSLIYNLINNALKYNENNPRISISMEDKYDKWLFSIKDNGIGISKENQNKIFELMYRVKEVKGTYEGTGIGLSSCKKIVEIHNGKIWLESELGKGSTFYFTIPKTNLNT